MKKPLILLGSLSLIFTSPPLYSQDPSGTDAASTPSNPWSLLEQQSTDLLDAVKKQDIHHIHNVAKAVQKEAIDLQIKSTALPVEEQKQFLDGLKEIGADADAIHHDAHHAQWDDALVQQGKLVIAIQKTASMLPEKDSGK